MLKAAMLAISLLVNQVPDIRLEYQVYPIVHNMKTKDIELAYNTMYASEFFGIDPLLLTSLINSESSYKKDTKHALDYVKGLSGINLKYWDLPIETFEDQIWSGAYVLRYYLDKYGEDELEALTRYKGKSQLGAKQAKKVFKEYNSYKEKDYFKLYLQERIL